MSTYLLKPSPSVFLGAQRQLACRKPNFNMVLLLTDIHTNPQQPITPKKHGRPQHNFFRYGLNWIVEKLPQRGTKPHKLGKLFL